MLYIFAGFPGKQMEPDSIQIHAGGLEHLVNVVEELAIVQKDSNLQYNVHGVCTSGLEGEFLYPLEYRISDSCFHDGITLDWFPENWSFGCGVTTHKTSASPEFKTVVHGTELDLNEFLTEYGTTRLAELELERRHIKHEGWEKYEARWLPGTCPQENHVVHLTWITTVDPMPGFAYERLRAVIEGGAELKDTHLYNHDPGAMFSTIRKWDGEPAFGGSNAVPRI